MKKLICFLLMIVMVISMLPISGFAVGTKDETVITYFEDGSYMIESIQNYQTRSSGTKTGAKEKVYYGSDGNACWKVVVTGTFSYTGSSVACTSSNCSVTIYKSDWYTVSKSATKSGNTATASVTMGQKLLGITIDKVSTSVTLTCDKNGNLS